MHRRFVLLLLLIISIAAFTWAVPVSEKERLPPSKYNTHAARVSDKLNVHVVCHTHDDVGWLKTIDQYYYGSNNTIQHAGVQFILDSVISSLLENPDRKFNYVEMAFFSRWWYEQNDETKKIVRKLVHDGQLSFINGGWCMHDEAATHYVDMVEQTALGHEFLLREFGVTPRITWQIDPFGHSSTQASLLSAEAGFDGLYFARIDYQDRRVRWNESRMEHLWRASPSLGVNSQVFTGTLADGYGPPSGFCFDMSCDDPAIQDDSRLEDVNVEDRVNLFVSEMMEQARHYRGNDVMITMGSDFQYENANEWFKNLDKLMHYVNQDGRINMFYSTPEAYTDAKHALNATWTVKEDDFFPYADGDHAYWTGYFTSRAALKRYVRDLSGYLQTVRHLEAASGAHGDATRDLWHSLGVAQHHDGVSGTSKQHVAYDYALRLSKGQNEAIDLANGAISKLTQKSDAHVTTFFSCPLANVSVCAAVAVATEEDNKQVMALVAYNPLGQARTQVLRVPISSEHYKVLDSKQQQIVSSVFSQFDDAAQQLEIGGDLPSSASAYYLAFEANVPAFGFETYFLVPDTQIKQQEETTNTVLENAHVKITFDEDTGKISSVLDKVTGASIKLTQDYHFYHSYAKDGQQNSGAYIFRPNGTDVFSVADKVKLQLLGDVNGFQEARQTWSDWITQTVRLSPNSAAVEIEWTVGPVPIEDGNGKEVIARFDSDIASNGVFYTDSNGRDAIKRVKDFRPTWTLNNTLDPITSNYFPVNAFIALNDANAVMALLTDRSEGGASLKDGSLELMVQRRTLADDSRGVAEPMNETLSITHGRDPQRIGPGMVIRGKIVMVVSKPEAAGKRVRTLQDQVYLPAVPFFAKVDSVEQYAKDSRLSAKLIAGDLPDNVQLMTLKALGQNTYLVRLSHQFGINEDQTLSQDVAVSLADLFAHAHIEHVEELTITANQPLKALNRLKWNAEDGAQQTSTLLPRPEAPEYNVKLTPLKIRTFAITLKAQ